MPQTAKVSALLSFIKTTTPDGGAGRVEAALSFLAELANGTGNGQCDVAFIDEARAIASGATEDLDLVGSLTDAFGNPVNAAEVVAIAIRAPSTNTASITVGGATAEFQGPFAAAGDKLVLRPGEWILLYSPTGWVAGAGSTDDLRFVCGSGAGNVFDIGVLARSA